MSSQSEQLVGVLAFFRTKEVGETGLRRPEGGSRQSVARSPRRMPPGRTHYAYASAPKALGAAAGGVSLKLRDKNDDVDKEFERY